MKVGLVGLGKAGIVLLDELVCNSQVENITVFDIEERKYASLSSVDNNKIEYAKNRNFLNSSFDLVVIATPDNLHLDYLIESLSLNIPSFLEKPYVSSPEQLKKVKELLSLSPHYKTTSNLILRSSPLFIALRDLYSSGKLGPKIFIEGKYLYGRWEKLQHGWRGYDGYSVTLGGLIHLIDLCCFITSNLEYRTCLAEHRITTKEPQRINDFSNITLSSEKSGFFSLSTSFSVGTEHRRDLSIYSDAGWIEIKGDNVFFGGEIFNNFATIPLSSPSKSALLHEYIAWLVSGDQREIHFPSTSEILAVMDICLGKSTL